MVRSLNGIYQVILYRNSAITGRIYIKHKFGISAGVAQLALTIDQATWVWSPAGKRIFLPASGSRAHKASYPVGTGGPSPSVKLSRGMTLATHPNLVTRSITSKSYTSSPRPSAFRTCNAYSFTEALVLVSNTNTSVLMFNSFYPGCYLTLGVLYELYKVALNKLRQNISRVRSNPNMKESARPHTSLRSREAKTKMRWSVLPHLAHSPDMAPSV
jgi:hypothetical protein